MRDLLDYLSVCPSVLEILIEIYLIVSFLATDSYVSAVVQSSYLTIDHFLAI